MNPSLRYRVKCKPEKVTYLGEAFIGKNCYYWIKGYCSFKGKCCFKAGTRM
jgi:hypothetical protein